MELAINILETEIIIKDNMLMGYLKVLDNMNGRMAVYIKVISNKA